MKRFEIRGGVALALAALLLGAGVVIARGTETARPRAAGTVQEDPRTAVAVPAAGRTAVLGEMRQMLTALNGVLLAMARGEADRMAEAARSGGTAIAVDRDPGMAAGLPEPFARLGMDTHRAFDALAEVAEAGAPRDTLLARLGRLTGNCVACHETYRLEVEEEDGR